MCGQNLDYCFETDLKEKILWHYKVFAFVFKKGSIPMKIVFDSHWFALKKRLGGKKEPMNQGSRFNNQSIELIV